jgi:hypothetical protein
VLSLLAGAAMPTGALLAKFDLVHPAILGTAWRHFIVAFGGGALISAVALLKYGSVIGFPRFDGNTSIALALSGFTAAWFGIRQPSEVKSFEPFMPMRQWLAAPKGLCLYLLSFELDETDAKNSFPVGAGLSVPINPWEDAVAQGFLEAGSMVAISRPGETFANSGASRVYVSDDEWQH